MKKFKAILCIIIVATLCMVMMGCTTNNYGKEFDKLDSLKEFLVTEEIRLKFPSALPYQDYKDIKFHYIASYDNEKKEYNGYKYYCFTNPFNIGVYGYHFLSDKPLSDDPEKLTVKKGIEVDGEVVNIYQGKGYNDSIFFLATATIDHMHYEIRISGNKINKDGVYINFIFEDNALYQQALDDIVSIYKSIKA